MNPDEERQTIKEKMEMEDEGVRLLMEEMRSAEGNEKE